MCHELCVGWESTSYLRVLVLDEADSWLNVTQNEDMKREAP